MLLERMKLRIVHEVESTEAAEESRKRALDTAKRIRDDYMIKYDMDRMRRELYRLRRLPDLHEEESDLMPPE